jgi:cytochrome c biogenesis protein CcdA
MKKQLFAGGLLVFLFVALAAVAYADPPTPHGEPPHGKPTQVLGLNPDLNPGNSLKRHGIFGTIKSLATPDFVVTTRQGDVTVTTNDATRYHIQTKRNGGLSDLAVGDRVAVNGTPTSGGLLAKQVAVAPGKPTIQHRVGIVTAYTAGSSITIKDVQGGTETFTLTSDTVIRGPNGTTTVKVGDRVTIVSRRDPDSNTFTATAIVVHPSE